MIDKGLVKLLLRTGPFALARRDISMAPLPKAQGVSAKHQFFLEGKDSMPLLEFGIGIHAIGSLIRLWDNMEPRPCPDCATASVIVDFGGSILTGAGKYTSWFCPACDKTFSKTPGCSVARVADTVKEASRTNALVIPSPDDQTPVLPNDLRPADLRHVFGGALLETYTRCAIEALETFDAEVSVAAREGKTFQHSFRIAQDGTVGDVVFGNVAGHAMIYKPGADRPCAGMPVSWDEHYGLWPTLYKAMERLSSMAGNVN